MGDVIKFPEKCDYPTELMEKVERLVNLLRTDFDAHGEIELLLGKHEIILCNYDRKIDG